MKPYAKDLMGFLANFGLNHFYDSSGALGYCTCPVSDRSFSNWTPAMRKAAGVLLDEGVVSKVNHVENNPVRAPGQLPRADAPSRGPTRGSARHRADETGADRGGTVGDRVAPAGRRDHGPRARRRRRCRHPAGLGVAGEPAGALELGRRPRDDRLRARASAPSRSSSTIAGDLDTTPGPAEPHPAPAPRTPHPEDPRRPDHPRAGNVRQPGRRADETACSSPSSGRPASVADRVARKASALARAHGLGAEKVAAAGEAARLEALGPLRQQYEGLLVRFGYVGMPSLSNTNFVAQLVKGAGVAPKKRFAWLFPDRRHALIVVRLHAGLSDPRCARSAPGSSGWSTRQACRASTPWLPGRRSSSRTPRRDVGHESAPPAAGGVRRDAAGPAFRPRRACPRGPPRAPAGAAVLLTAGLSWPLGLGYTGATLAALPVVLGLALDYAVQLQARYWGQRGEGWRVGRPPSRRSSGWDRRCSWPAPRRWSAFCCCS